MATKFELTAEKRETRGTGDSRRLRRLGKVPGVLYGGARDPVMLTFAHDAVLHQLANEAFHTSILTVKVDGEADQAILRDVQMHPFRPRIMHIDLQRVVATEKLHIAVRIHFTGEAIAPGVKEQGGIVSHLMTEIDISCLPHQLPEFLTVDVSQLRIGDAVHLSQVSLPEGVSITSLGHGGSDVAVVTIVPPRAEEEEVAPAAAEVPVEGEAAPAAEGAAPAPGAEAKPAEPARDKDKDKDRDRGRSKEKDRD